MTWAHLQPFYGLPIITLASEKGLGARMREMVELVAETVDSGVITDCGHFVPEERPDEVVRHVLIMTNKVH
jgi:pimeloyl-ACP methyl ester carboxylesterase